MTWSYRPELGDEMYATSYIVNRDDGGMRVAVLI